MAAKSAAFAGDILKLVFHATAIAGLADNDATSPLTQLSVALHTADPGIGGNQSTSECAYTGYARLLVTRDASGWGIAGDDTTGWTVKPAALLAFGQCTAGSETATHASVGIAGSGATKILYRGAISPTIAISNTVTPELTTNTVIAES